MSDEDQIIEVETPKRRGRKPKPPVVVDDGLDHSGDYKPDPTLRCPCGDVSEVECLGCADAPVTDHWKG